MALTLIGYWHPDDANSSPWPKVDDFVDSSWSLQERDVVIQWLESGIEVRQYFGYSSCRVCHVRNGSTELSDGVFLWPIGLSHYVREHLVRLPDRVVARALEPPALDRHRVEALAEGDEVETDWWRNQKPDWASRSIRGS